MSLFKKLSELKMPPTDGQEGSRRFKFELSLGGLIAVGVATVLGLAWIFILGVLLGRGYRPENKVPEIARIMPAPPQEAVPQAKPEVLKPEELDYMNAVTKTVTAPAAPEKKPEQAQVEQPKPAPVRKVEAPKAAPKASEQKSGPRYAYAYQAAAFSERTQAESLQSKIRSIGFNCSLEPVKVKGKTWHRVIVSFNGTPNDAKAMKDKLAPLGINGVILKKKQPI